MLIKGIDDLPADGGGRKSFAGHLQIMLSRLPGVGHLPRIEEGNDFAAARSRTGAGPVDAHAAEVSGERGGRHAAVGRRRVEKVGAGPCLQGVCRQVLRQGGQRKRPGAVVGRFPLRWRQVADINPGRGRQRFAGFHHQDPRGAAIGNSAGKSGAHRAAANNQYIDVFIHISPCLCCSPGACPLQVYRK